MGDRRKLRYISLFSGIEAVSCALDHRFWEPVAFSEIDDFPSAVLDTRFPKVPNLGDITKIDWTPYSGRVDVVWGGSPCFPAGALVMTSDGCKPIENVEIGDVVLTHRNRWRKVTAVGHKTSDTVVVKAQGTSGIECTDNHPFYSCEKRRSYDGVSHRTESRLTDPEWVEAGKLSKRMILNMGETEPLPVDQPTNTPAARDVELNSNMFYFVGRWLGDGWANECRHGDRGGTIKRVYVCDSVDKADELRGALDRTGLHFGMTEVGATVRFVCSSTVLYDWIIRNFGVHAIGKRIPGWCFGMRRE